MRANSGVAVIALIGFACSSARTADVAPRQPIARMTVVTGDVRILRGNVWEPLAVGDEIDAADQIQTMARGSASVTMLATSARLDLAAATTIRMDSGAQPRAVAGHVDATVHDPAQSQQLELGISAATLVLTADRDETAAAAVDVASDATTIELHAGRASVVPQSGEPTKIASHERVVFDPAGHRLAARPAGHPQVERTAEIALLEPDAGAHLRVRQNVTLRWQPVAGIVHYGVSVASGALSRTIEVDGASLALPLATGHYTWSVHGEAASSASRELDVEVHATPPALEIELPAQNATVVGPKLRIAGMTSVGAIVDVDGARAVTDASGHFAVDIVVARGLSNLVVTARDTLGNQRRIARSVVWP